MSDITGFKTPMAAIKASKKQLRKEIKNVLSQMTSDDVVRQCRQETCISGLLIMLTV